MYILHNPYIYITYRYIYIYVHMHIHAVYLCTILTWQEPLFDVLNLVWCRRHNRVFSTSQLFAEKARKAEACHLNSHGAARIAAFRCAARALRFDSGAWHWEVCLWWGGEDYLWRAGLDFFGLKTFRLVFFFVYSIILKYIHG